MPSIEKIFLICHDKDRFDRVYTELCARNLDRIMIPLIATDPSDLPPSVARKLTECDFDVEDRAKFDSHRKAWTLIVNMGISYAMILEDNVKCSNLDSVLDVVEQYKVDSLNIGAYDSKNLQLTPYGTYVADLSREGPTGAYGCACYLISTKAAKVYLEGSNDVYPKQVDLYISSHAEIQQHVILPSYVDVRREDTCHKKKEHSIKCNWIPMAFIVFLAALLLFFYMR